jgi:serine phosphatase RsbU (regulator of sigma subunit)
LTGRQDGAVTASASEPAPVAGSAPEPVVIGQAGAEFDWATDPVRRATLLADVTLELTTTLDVEAALGRLARMTVPRLGDWCIVTLQGDDESLHDVDSWHSDPAKRDDVARYAELRLGSLTEDAFVHRAMREGTLQVVRSSATAKIAQVLRPGPALELLNTLAPESLIVLPMTARGRTVGMLSIYSGAGRPAPSDVLIGVAAEVAARAALVVDNALTYADAVRARESAEAMGRRLALLARVTEALSSTMDGQEAVTRLARLVVPQLADWCVVTIRRRDGSFADLGFAHRDPRRLPDVAAFCAARARVRNIWPGTAVVPESAADRAGEPALVTALSTGVPVVIPDVSTDGRPSFWSPAGWSPGGWSSEAAHEPSERLIPSGVAILPIVLRDQVLGALTLVTTPARGPHTEDELATAAEIARRAASSLENIRLYGEQRRLAEELQRSLLTEPPQPDHLEIVVRYVPAAHEAQVGGDWYDAFLQQDGATMLAIGDVVGHDTRAAAAMGQVRTLLRGIAYTSDASPAGVLTRLDAALLGLQLETTATVLLARLEQPSDEASGRRLLRWSNAGHPPPLVRPPDGPVGMLDGTGDESDLLLGIDPLTPRCDHTMLLEAGSVVLLYTDGLVERRGMSLDAGIERLRTAVSKVADHQLAELCDAVLDALMPEEAENDVALVAVRLHPQDRERPAEAGAVSVPRTVR